MPDDTAQGLWQRWLDAEIGRCEGELIAAPPHRKIEVWRRLDLLHALRDEHPEAAASALSVAAGRFGRPIAAGLIAGAVVLGTLFVWLLGAELGLAI